MAMALAAAGDDALALWLEHGARYAARTAALAAAVREAREAALDAVRDVPAWPPVVPQAGASAATNPAQSRGPLFHSRAAGAGFHRDIAADAVEDARRQRAALREARRQQRDAIERRARQEAAAAEAASAAAALAQATAPVAAVPSPSLKETEPSVDQNRAAVVAAGKALSLPDPPGLSLNTERQSHGRSSEKTNGAAVHDATGIAVHTDAVAGSLAAANNGPNSETPANVLTNGSRPSSASGILKGTQARTQNEASAAAPDPLPEHAMQVARVWGRVASEADKFAADPVMKRPRLLLKKRVNRAVNQIAASVKSVCIKISDLVGTLNESSQSGIPAALSFTMKEIAERLVSEGAGSVALSRPAAFAVGHVIVGVTANSPDPTTMRCVILGAFYSKCSYIVPTYVRRHKHETETSYRSRLNYLSDETPEAYVERMCGYVTLYAAIVQTTDVHGAAGLQRGARNPFRPEEAWGWLARVVNGPQRSITPDILQAFLDVAGYELSRLFGSSFASLLASVRTVCVRHASKDARPGAKSRIEGFIEEYVRFGHKVPNAPVGKYLPLSDAENKA